MDPNPTRRRWLGRTPVRAETLLSDSPRALEITCALFLGGLALMVLYDFAMHRWFYFMFHQYYRTTPESRAYDWTLACGEVLLGCWSGGLAIDLLRGTSRRRDHGLFSPMALRVWGVLFALAPVVLVAISSETLAHVHLFLWSWGAAAACFALAARRARMPRVVHAHPPIE